MNKLILIISLLFSPYINAMEYDYDLYNEIPKSYPREKISAAPVREEESKHHAFSVSFSYSQLHLQPKNAPVVLASRDYLYRSIDINSYEAPKFLNDQQMIEFHKLYMNGRFDDLNIIKQELQDKYNNKSIFMANTAQDILKVRRRLSFLGRLTNDNTVRTKSFEYVDNNHVQFKIDNELEGALHKFTKKHPNIIGERMKNVVHTVIDEMKKENLIDAQDSFEKIANNKHLMVRFTSGLMKGLNPLKHANTIYTIALSVGEFLQDMHKVCGDLSKHIINSDFSYEKEFLETKWAYFYEIVNDPYEFINNVVVAGKSITEGMAKEVCQFSDYLNAETIGEFIGDTVFFVGVSKACKLISFLSKCKLKTFRTDFIEKSRTAALKWLPSNTYSSCTTPSCTSPDARKCSDKAKKLFFDTTKKVKEHISQYGDKHYYFIDSIGRSQFIEKLKGYCGIIEPIKNSRFYILFDDGKEVVRFIARPDSKNNFVVCLFVDGPQGKIEYALRFMKE